MYLIPPPPQKKSENLQEPLYTEFMIFFTAGVYTRK